MHFRIFYAIIGEAKEARALEHKLYVMVSRTETGIGRIIRTVSQYPYNHVSLSLDPNLRSWVSFARHIQNAPLYGGFIHESPQRFLAEGRDAQVRIFAIDICPERYRSLEALFAIAGQIHCGLLYNLFDAAASVVGLRIPLPGAYTCLSFANTVLGSSYGSISALCRGLEAHLVYEGFLSSLVQDDGSRDEPYFRHLGPVQATWQAARHFAALSGRAFRPDFPDPLAEQLQQT